MNNSDPTGLASAGTICGEYGSSSSQCADAQQLSKQVVGQELANQQPGNAHIIDIAGSLSQAVADAQSFLENHVSLSAEVCWGSCVGIDIQDGRFQVIDGTGGHLYGAGLDLNVTSGPPCPAGESFHSVEVGEGGYSWGPGGSKSVGFGPGYVFGWGTQNTTMQFG